MVQEFHVLRCFSCEIFQVQQVKKVKKWSCKVCGEKQSVLKEFGRGSGADCRRHVQKLNAARGAKMEDEAERRAEMDVQALWNDETEVDEDERLSHKPVSRWDKFLPPPQEEAGLTPKGVEPEEGSVVLDRDLLQSSVQRAKRAPHGGQERNRRAPHGGQERKRRRGTEQDEFGPGYDTSPPRTVPRAVPTVPRAVPTVPRAVPTVPRAVPTVPRAVPTVPRAVPTVPRAVPRAVPTVSKALRPVSKWSAFLEPSSASGSSVSVSSMFQSGDDVDLDLDLDLDWV